MAPNDLLPRPLGPGAELRALAETRLGCPVAGAASSPVSTARLERALSGNSGAVKKRRAPVCSAGLAEPRSSW